MSDFEDSMTCALRNREISDFCLFIFTHFQVCFFDLGGHEHYESILTLIARNHRMHLCLAKPCYFESDEFLDEAVGPWIDKMMNGAVQPHALFAVTHIDEIPEESKKSKISEMTNKFVKYLADKANQVKKIRQEKLADLQKQHESVKQDLLESLDPAEKVSLEAKEASLNHKVSRQIFKLNHIPNFNEDLVTFVSTETKEGLDVLLENLPTAISKLPKTKLQEHWKDATEMMLSKDDAFVNFDDCLKESKLSEKDFKELLEALCTTGHILWSDEPGRKSIIFPSLHKVSQMMKSIFFHEMEEIIDRYAKHRGLDGEQLKDAYKKGLLPTGLIEDMFVYLGKQLSGPEKPIKVDYSGFPSSTRDPDALKVVTPFIETLKAEKIVIQVEDNVSGEKMSLIPHLITVAPQQHLSEWIGERTKTTHYQLAVMFESEMLVTKPQFAKCHTSIVAGTKQIANLMGLEVEPKREPRKCALVVDFAHFQVFLWYHLRAIYLSVNLTNATILSDAVWIILYELASRLDIDSIFVS